MTLWVFISGSQELGQGGKNNPMRRRSKRMQAVTWVTTQIRWPEVWSFQRAVSKGNVEKRVSEHTYILEMLHAMSFSLRFIYVLAY